MIECHTHDHGATIDGQFHKMSRRLARALEKLVANKGKPTNIDSMWNGSLDARLNAKVAISQLRAVLAGTKYRIVASDYGDGTYVLGEDESRDPNK